MLRNNKQNSRSELGHSLAHFVSAFVSPPIMAIVATVSFSLWSPIGLGLLSAPLSIMLCFLLFSLFPFLPVFYYYRKNVIDLYISKKEARTPFFVFAIFSYASAAVLFFFTGTKIILLLALGYTLVTGILMVVNLFWKVSIHCAGVTGPIFALIFVFGPNVLPLSLIIVLLGWSRIKLKNHTFFQTVVGTLISLSVGLIEYSILYP